MERIITFCVLVFHLGFVASHPFAYGETKLQSYPSIAQPQSSYKSPPQDNNLKRSSLHEFSGISYDSVVPNNQLLLNPVQNNAFQNQIPPVSGLQLPASNPIRQQILPTINPSAKINQNLAQPPLQNFAPQFQSWNKLLQTPEAKKKAFTVIYPDGRTEYLDNIDHIKKQYPHYQVFNMGQVLNSDIQKPQPSTTKFNIQKPVHSLSQGAIEQQLSPNVQETQPSTTTLNILQPGHPIPHRAIEQQRSPNVQETQPSTTTFNIQKPVHPLPHRAIEQQLTPNVQETQPSTTTLNIQHPVQPIPRRAIEQQLNYNIQHTQPSKATLNIQNPVQLVPQRAIEEQLTPNVKQSEPSKTILNIQQPVQSIPQRALEQQMGQSLKPNTETKTQTHSVSQPADLNVSNPLASLIMNSTSAKTLELGVVQSPTAALPADPYVSTPYESLVLNSTYSQPPAKQPQNISKLISQNNPGTKLNNQKKSQVESDEKSDNTDVSTKNPTKLVNENTAGQLHNNQTQRQADSDEKSDNTDVSSENLTKIYNENTAGPQLNNQTQKQADSDKKSDITDVSTDYPTKTDNGNIAEPQLNNQTQTQADSDKKSDNIDVSNANTTKLVNGNTTGLQFDNQTQTRQASDERAAYKGVPTENTTKITESHFTNPDNESHASNKQGTVKSQLQFDNQAHETETDNPIPQPHSWANRSYNVTNQQKDDVPEALETPRNANTDHGTPSNTQNCNYTEEVTNSNQPGKILVIDRTGIHSKDLSEADSEIISSLIGDSPLALVQFFMVQPERTIERNVTRTVYDNEHVLEEITQSDRYYDDEPIITKERRVIPASV